MDRNSYYGGDSASLSLEQLWEKFRKGEEAPKELGRSNDYNVDLVPKFMLGDGKLIKVLIHTDVVKYLEFKACDGSYVYKQGKIHKVPASDMEALKSPLMSFFEKRRARNFFIYVQDYEENDPRTFQGRDLRRMTMRQLFNEFSLGEDTIDFIGHSLALYRDDAYLDQAALPAVKKVKLYHDSLYRFAGTKTPYIYPLYGLGELPQSFARLSAVYGGTYMLNKPDCEVVYDEQGRACGVQSDGETAKCKFVVGDPSYFPGKTKVVGRVARAICIMSHPIPGTVDAHSVQIVIPQKQVGRRSDVYVFCSSYAHNVAANGKYIAFVSTTVETNNPARELDAGLSLLGPVDHKFIYVTDDHMPTNNGGQDKCFISKGYDATTHFESTVDDVLEMYTKITGKELDLDKLSLNQTIDG
mmetsp:Transcript_9395/g.24125  ORF Transcript_9395/g.24125 Transcript_9395/m.24125 type:complete len:413 (+) Transcript_9395:256-1494(+)